MGDAERTAAVTTHDLIVIGAGLYGLQAVRTYLAVHPAADVLAFEADAHVGGVWSAGRMYDAFQTQTPLRIAEFSDRPLRGVPAAECYHDFFPARHLTPYLEAYAAPHVAAGRIRLSTPVRRVRKTDAGLWEVSVGDGAELHAAPRLVDASGLTSDPNVPAIPGLRDGVFAGPALHQRAFGGSGVLADAALADVVVLGGAKSAADMAYACAKAGKRVSWVIREAGAGPCAFVPAAGVGPYRNSNESTYTRFFAQLLASVFVAPGWLAWALYHTSLGRWLQRRFWAGINEDAVRLAGFDRPEHQKNGFGNLRPDTTVFWQNDSTGVNQRADFFDVIADRVTVYRDEVVRMTEKHMVLKGATVPCDALLLATGWVSRHPYLDQTLAAELGLPAQTSEDVDMTSAKRWALLDAQADSDAVARFPLLSKPPQYRKPAGNTSPFRLYKSMLPVDDHSIAFIGKTMLGNNFRNAEVQALWATAALDGRLKLPPRQEMEMDVSRVLAWCRRRYLAKGALGNWFYFDVVPYNDMLLDQLGLSSHRKRPWWRDFFEPCFASDLRGLIPEYIQKIDLSGNGKKM